MAGTGVYADQTGSNSAGEETFPIVFLRSRWSALRRLNEEETKEALR